MKKTIVLSACIIAAFGLLRCNDPKPAPGGETGTTGAIPPAKFPDTGIPGFHFPEDSNIINKWLASDDTASIVAHGWGIWAGLTTRTGDTVEMQDIYVYETWETPTELQAKLQTEPGASAAKPAPAKPRNTLKFPPQEKHAAKFTARLMALNPGLKANPAPGAPCNQPQYTVGVYPLFDAVAYDIPGAEHILTNKLYDFSQLSKWQAEGKTDIPDFPHDAIATKPRYAIIHQSQVVNGFFPFRVWDGPNFCDSGYGPKQWPGLVYVDVNNKSAGDGSVDKTNSGMTPQNSYNINSFMYYRLTQADADASDDTADKAGDYAVLVAMHVTSKEIKRWTWQTYWWTPNPTMPPFPSSAFVASKRPAQVTGAAAHYAMSIGYSFTTPNQPLTGGSKAGEPVYAFNPFLEAGFGTNVFGGVASVVITKRGPVYNRVGCQTNCMSCHAGAIFSKDSSITTQPGNYITDTYVDFVKDPYFNNVLKLDFLWSIQSSLIKK